MPTNVKVLYVILFFSVTLLGFVGVTFGGSDDSPSEKRQEEKVALSQVPAPVKATIEQEIKRGTLKEIEKTTVEGKTALRGPHRRERQPAGDGNWRRRHGDPPGGCRRPRR